MENQVRGRGADGGLSERERALSTDELRGEQCLPVVREFAGDTAIAPYVATLPNYCEIASEWPSYDDQFIALCARFAIPERLLRD